MSRALSDVALTLCRWCLKRGALPDRGELADVGTPHLSALEALEIDSLLYLACEKDVPAQRLYDAVWQVQRAALRECLSALADVGVPALVLKSAELIPAAFGTRSIGLMTDVDLLVPRVTAVVAKSALLSLGFRQAVYDQSSGQLVDRDIADIGRIESTHYELAPFCRLVPIDVDRPTRAVGARRSGHPVYDTTDGLMAVVEVDLHHAIASDVESEWFFQRAVPSLHEGSLTMSPADHLWVLLTRHYNETALHGKRSMRTFAYTLPLLDQPELDWDTIGDVARTLNLGPTLYYYLYFCDWLAAGRVPKDVLAALHPGNGSRIRDWGWQIARLFNELEPFPLARHA